MKLFKSFAATAVALAVFSCASAQAPGYTVTIPMTEDEDGLKAYLVDYDSSENLDSTTIADGKAVFKGSIASPALVQLVIDGARSGMFILEPGNITGDLQTRSFSGTQLNERLIDFGKEAGELIKSYRALQPDSNAAAKAADIQARYQALTRRVLDENASNPLGYYLFLQEAYDMTIPQLDEALATNPAFSRSKRVQRLRTNLVKKDETSVGKMYKDFSIKQPDGSVKKLSDYVGNGKYALVDFWASWCGPCIRETKVIKELYNKYADKGLEVLGVAVWDEPQNTMQAIKTHELPWKQIINAQSVPTDIYGISGIPCIILFDPEGKIISRDKQDADLVADVDAAMEAAAAPRVGAQEALE